MVLVLWLVMIVISFLLQIYVCPRIQNQFLSIEV